MTRPSLLVLLLVFTPSLSAQMNMPAAGRAEQDMAGMTMAGMNMGGPAQSFTQNVERHSGSGTSLEPASSAPAMLMDMRPSGWMLMLHGNASLVEQQQTGPRGHDKFFSVNWAMLMAQLSRGSNQITLRAMLSLEPATITGRYYPELFQEGETAYGQPIVDGQHPHDLFMELGALYDRKLGARGLLTLYGAPVGDPALGPEAFPHRASAGNNPLAPLSHHLQDSTHIAEEVVTVGLSLDSERDSEGDSERRSKARGLRAEASGFHGREPDENRWHIEAGAIDSWATRLTATPGKDWLAQYSLGHLHAPEQAHPGEDVLRQTASVSYHHETPLGPLNAVAIWGRNHTIGSPINANGYLLEAALRPQEKQTVWTRLENADRTSDLLGAAAPPVETVVGRVAAFTGGYAHSVFPQRHGNWKQGTVELGGQFTGYKTPASLTAIYGAHAFGFAAVLNVRLGRGEQ